MKPLHIVAALASTKHTTLIDPEFGEIHYRRLASARYVRIRVAQDGSFRASLPSRAPLSSLEALINSSREELRKYAQTATHTTYQHDQRIGQSHTLKILRSTRDLRGTLHGQTITVAVPAQTNIDSAPVQTLIRTYVGRALRVEAKAYLPRRLKYLAEQYGFHYEKLRFAHQAGRWGSCSSGGTISLNIALMNLPFELIDYVLIHELAHTRQMNHSREFWDEVEQLCPNYKAIRARLKKHSPDI